MSKSTAPAKSSAVAVTLKSEGHAAELIPDGLMVAVTDAFGVKTITYRKRADVVRRLLSTGLSHKGIFAALTIRYGAAGLPDGLTSDTIVSRYAAVVTDGITAPAVVAAHKSAMESAGTDKGERAAVQAEVDGIIKTLFQLTGGQGGSKARMVDALASIPEGADLLTVSATLADAHTALSAERKTAALSPATRGTKGPKAGRTQGDADADTDADADADGAGHASETLTARISRLADDLAGIKSEDLTAALADALADLVAVATSLVGADVEEDILA